ncbi:unnamed protein product [Linum trigynum]|uniref:Uncharacterized protein n=1 Tax=Linum trigynum TaxID=586398 RepID=A0AAV2C9K2_9ROSI
MPERGKILINLPMVNLVYIHLNGRVDNWPEYRENLKELLRRSNNAIFIQLRLGNIADPEFHFVDLAKLLLQEVPRWLKTRELGQHSRRPFYFQLQSGCHKYNDNGRFYSSYRTPRA